MASNNFRWALAAVILALGVSGNAATRAAEPETAPTPRQNTEDPAVFSMDVPHPGYFRVSRYAVWENYGVDRSGHFRVRVIASPYGAYYMYNGQPYPWTVTHSLDIMPYAVD